MEEFVQAAGMTLGSGDWSRLQDADMLVRIALQVVLLGASAFFSGSEVGLFSLSQAELSQLRRRRDAQAGRIQALLDQPRRLIISILCGNEFINVAAAANMAAILLALFDEATASVMNLLVMVPLLLLFGEVTPKTIAIADPVRFSTRVVARPMSAWVRLVTPLRWAVRQVADRLTTLLVGEEKATSNILMPDEVRTLVRELQESGELKLEERDLFDRLLESGATEVVSVMVPRTRMAFVSEEASLAVARDLMTTRRQQRIAVYAGHHDNLRGLIFAEDLMALALAGEDLEARSVIEMLQPVTVVPPTKRLDEMLEYFLSNQRLAAVVLNEFGGVEGMVTIRNLVDFVFDPICGLTPKIETFSAEEPGVFNVPGDMKLNEFNDLTNLGISDPRMTTVAGVVFRHLDRLPVEGDRVVVDGVCFEVLAMAEHRIEQVRASRDGKEGAEVRDD